MVKRFLNIKEVSKLLGMSIAVINKFIKEGSIPSYKIGKRRLFDQEEIVAWVKTHREGKE